MKRNFLRTISALSVASLLMVSCGSDKTAETAKEEKIINVQVATVVTEDVDQIYDFTSTIEPKVKNYISSAGGTRIEKIFVEVGDRVSKGQTLVKMESTSVATAQAQVDNLGIELNRLKALYASGGASKQSLDQLQVQYDVAQKNLKNLKDNIVLTSPITGVVTMKNFDNGDIAGSQPILQVMQISPVKLKFSVNESLYTKVKLGMPVSAKVEVFGDEEFTGRITLISPTIDANSRTFYIEAEFNNANTKLRPGMFGRATLNLGKAINTVIPDQALIKQNGTNDKYVYVLNSNNTVTYKKVAVGRRIGGKYAILEGLNEGDKVVVSDYSKLKNGSKVKVVK
ncbi:MAG: efflux RND transporter periplasmic adaptor subunit [Bacteroidales bacterium]|nr:efflux RND transporter periplasmic adaptor subunit [Bacteroidales bacterium]